MEKKVLIVDDNNGFSRVVCKEIERSGHRTFACGNGVDALLLYLEGDIDIVLMDVVMPRLSGIDALRIIRKIDPSAKVVIFTGNPSEEMRNSALEHGASEFLSKPFSLRTLIDIVCA